LLLYTACDTFDEVVDMAIPATDNSRTSGSVRRKRSIWLFAVLCLCHVVLATETLDDDSAPVDASVLPSGEDSARPENSKAAPDAPSAELKTLSPKGHSPAPDGNTAASSPQSPVSAATPDTVRADLPVIEPGLAPLQLKPADRNTEVQDQSSNPIQNPPFKLLGAEVPAGESRKLSWLANQHYSGIETPTPVLVAHGVQPGKVLCVTAAVHGDEINGIEIARRVFYKTDPKELTGTLIVLPIVNLHGFERGYRYLADRRDLNRYFPGVADRSSASRIAHSLFTGVIRHCQALVDLHTGSFHRTNLPQLRADLSNAGVVQLTKGFGATAVLNDKGASGTLRRAATDGGIPAVVLEAGEPLRFQPEEVQHGAKGVESLMFHLGMVKKSWHWGEPQPVYYEALWVRASQGGILMASVEPGDKVEMGQLLGTVTDPISNVRTRVLSPQSGRVLGMAVNQMVMPGYAMFRIGIEHPAAQIAAVAEAPSQATEADAPPANNVGDSGSATSGDGSRQRAVPGDAAKAAAPPAAADESSDAVDGGGGEPENVHADE